MLNGIPLPDGPTASVFYIVGAAILLIGVLVITYLDITDRKKNKHNNEK